MARGVNSSRPVTQRERVRGQEGKESWKNTPKMKDKQIGRQGRRSPLYNLAARPAGRNKQIGRIFRPASRVGGLRERRGNNWNAQWQGFAGATTGSDNSRIDTWACGSDNLRGRAYCVLATLPLLPVIRQLQSALWTAKLRVSLCADYLAIFLACRPSCEPTGDAVLQLGSVRVLIRKTPQSGLAQLHFAKSFARSGCNPTRE